MIGELKTIVEGILSSQDTKNEVATTLELGVFYKKLLTSLNINANSEEFTTIVGGIALSPQHAIDCLEDGVRTARFLKGVHKALNHKLQTHQSSTLEVVYAGCGPLATLLVPLLTLINSDRLRITLLDIHEVSILSSKKIIEHLELTNFDINFHTCDATKYIHPRKIDVLITETMDKGLTREPQVSISEHLCQFLSTEGVLIPKQISLYAGTALFSDLPKRKTHLHHEKTPDLIDYNHVLFSVNRGSRISFEGFESKLIECEQDFDSKPDVCVYTEIEVFDGVFLRAGDAFITDPICILFPNRLETTHYSLCYATKPSPTWSIKPKNDTE